jgi:predicted component of type VI protein secretion system
MQHYIPADEKPREPTDAERSLIGKRFRDPDTEETFQVTAVGYSERFRAMLAHYRQIKQRRDGTWRQLARHESSSTDEVQEWICMSDDLNAVL